jgi:hypothetical protein
MGETINEIAWREREKVWLGRLQAADRRAEKSEAELAQARKELSEWQIQFCIATGTTGAFSRRPEWQIEVVQELLQRASHHYETIGAKKAESARDAAVKLLSEEED